MMLCLLTLQPPPAPAPAGFSKHPRPPSPVDAHYTNFCADYIHSWDHAWYLQIGHPADGNRQHVSIFFKKDKPV